MGYLNRMGFFDQLAPSVEVLPERPMYSGAKLFEGANAGLVEIARINKDDRDPSLLTRLRGQFTLELAAYNLIGLPGLLGAAP